VGRWIWNQRFSLCGCSSAELGGKKRHGSCSLLQIFPSHNSPAAFSRDFHRTPLQSPSVGTPHLAFYQLLRLAFILSASLGFRRCQGLRFHPKTSPSARRLRLLLACSPAASLWLDTFFSFVFHRPFRFGRYLDPDPFGDHIQLPLLEILLLFGDPVASVRGD
jgi:hypothetical protein